MAQYYVKAVDAHIEESCAPELTSITEGAYRVWYQPSAWTKPVLPGSKLFVFPSLISAIEFVSGLESGFRLPTEIPFSGIMLWWCLAEGVTSPEQTIHRDLPDNLIELYWNEYPYFPISPPKVYRFPWGVGMTKFADRVKLVHPVINSEVRKVLK